MLTMQLSGCVELIVLPRLPIPTNKCGHLEQFGSESAFARGSANRDPPRRRSPGILLSGARNDSVCK